MQENPIYSGATQTPLPAHSAAKVRQTHGALVQTHLRFQESSDAMELDRILAAVSGPQWATLVPGAAMCSKARVPFIRFISLSWSSQMQSMNASSL